MKLTKQEDLYLRAKKAYYEGVPFISDVEFDILEEELKQINSTAISMVGYKIKGIKVKHSSPMKSLDKIQFQSDYTPFKEWIKWVSQHPDQEAFLEWTPKFDGNAVNLIYENGVLQKAITRGDGIEGQDITDKLRYRVPTTIPYIGKLEIRGEVVISVKTFKIKYAKKYKNARNFVAGMLNRDQLEMDILQDLVFLGFELKKVGEKEIHFEQRNIELLVSWGFHEIFSIYLPIKECISIGAFISIFKKFLNLRKVIHYLIDGFVVKFGAEMRTSNMEKDHHPKWSLAIKFPPKIGKTKIKDIEWNMSTLGALIPVAILDPVDLDGSTIQRVILHNYQWAVEKGCGIGAQIEIVKSGDIIPKVLKVISPGQVLKIPETYEGMTVVRKGVHIGVSDPVSLDSYQKLRLHKGITCLKIKNVGPSSVNKLYKAGFKNIISLFKGDLTEEKLIATGIFKKGRELELLLENILDIKEVQFKEVIEALQIQNMGSSISRELAKYFTNLKYDFAGFEKAIVESFISEDSKEQKDLANLYTAIEKSGIRVVRPVEINESRSKGFFELTGSPKEHGFKIKGDFIKLAALNGYIHTKLNKNCNFLLTDSYNSVSSKIKKAEKLGCKILTYSDFIKKYIEL